MEYYTAQTKRGFDPGIYKLHVGTNDLILGNTSKKIAD